MVQGPDTCLITAYGGLSSKKDKTLRTLAPSVEDFGEARGLDLTRAEIGAHTPAAKG